MEEKNKDSSLFEAMTERKRRWRNGAFQEMTDDWKWIFSPGPRCRKAIMFYVLPGHGYRSHDHGVLSPC